MYSEDFAEWWSEYPRKTGKRKAWMKWQAAIKEIEKEKGLGREAAIDWLLQRTALFAQSDKGRGDYCPYPATWLYQGRYDDDPEEWNEGRSQRLDIDAIRKRIRDE